MKTLCKFILILLMIPVAALGNNPTHTGKYTKEKKISKTYDVAKDAKLLVDNRYGNVDITTWNKNSIAIEVTIITSGNQEQEVQKRLDDISVSFSASSSQVSAATTISNQRNNWTFWGTKSNNVSMKINYVIKMPVSNHLDLKNHYGFIRLDKLSGDASISCDYGSFIIGELLGNNNQLHFDYTQNATIDYVKHATIKADYSDFSIHKADKVSYKGNYSKAEFKQVLSTLDFNCSYGRINTGSVQNITGKSRYLTTAFGTVLKSLQLDANYGNIKVADLAQSIQKVTIHSRYTNIDLKFDAAAQFDLKTKLSYANLKADDQFDFYVKQIQNTSSSHEGFYGKRNSGNFIDIASDYGNIKIFRK